MVTLIQMAKVLVLLLLAALVLSFIVAVARPETGLAENGALLLLVVGLVAVAVKVTSLAELAKRRLRRH